MTRSIFELITALQRRGTRINPEALKQGLTNPLKQDDPGHQDKVEAQFAHLLTHLGPENRLHLTWKRALNARWLCTPNVLHVRNPERVFLPEPDTTTLNVCLVRAEADFALQMAGAPDEYVTGDLHSLVAERTGLPRQETKIAFYEMLYGLDRHDPNVKAVSALLPEVVEYRNSIIRSVQAAGTRTPRRTLVLATHGNFGLFLQTALTEINDRWLERIDLDLAFHYHDGALLLVPQGSTEAALTQRVTTALRDTLGELCYAETVPPTFRMHCDVERAPWGAEGRQSFLI